MGESSPEARFAVSRTELDLRPQIFASIPGFICAYRFGADGTSESISESDVAGQLAHGPGWMWLHLNLADARSGRWLIEAAGLPSGAVQELLEAPTRQTISAIGETITGHVTAFHRMFDSDTTDHCWLHFLLLENTLITGRTKAIHSAEQLRQNLARGATYGSPRQLLAGLVAKYADRLDSILHGLTDSIELIEDHVLDDRHRGERRRLMLLRREAASHHRHTRAMRRALLAADRSIDDFPQEFGPLITRLSHLDQDFEVLEARARFFHDEIDAKLAAETNRQLFILSALTAGFLPPALVAGLFGMNVPGIPWANSSAGFYLALLLSALSSAAVFLFMWLSNRRG